MLAWQWIRVGETPTPDQYRSFLNVAPMPARHIMRLWANADYEFMEKHGLPEAGGDFSPTASARSTARIEGIAEGVPGRDDRCFDVCSSENGTRA